MVKMWSSNIKIIMLLQFDSAVAASIITNKLTASQQVLMKKQGIRDPMAYLTMRPKQYVLRRHTILMAHIQTNQSYGIIGKLRNVRKKTMRKNMIMYYAELQTATHSLDVIWFNQNYIMDHLDRDPWVVATGMFEDHSFGRQFQVQQFEIHGSFSSTRDNQMIPMYPPIRGVSNRMLVSIIQTILDTLPMTDLLPHSDRLAHQLVSMDDAIRWFHFPSNQAQLDAAIQRLAFDELLLYLLPRRMQYFNTTQSLSRYPIRTNHAVLTEYVSRLPYELTSAQQRVWRHICDDFSRNVTVFRLIQGDVGSGKTDVAILSLLATVGSGHKAAVLVPTEILADQHYQKLISRCEGLNVPILLLKGKQSKKVRAQMAQQLASPTPLIVVGTHALVQSTVQIQGLGLVIIDEQHRFGVFQRQQLLEKSDDVPHCLFMSATPIPRTLMLTHYGDLDHDIIDELPPGRKPPKTYYAKPRRLREVYGFIRSELHANRQAYVVYPLIESSDHLTQLAPAMEGFELLSQEFSDANVGLLHGKMPNQDKQCVMQRFKDNQIHILVSTTVIEVGVDVPNASTMVIMNAERFGLSQLHQLRGRVGRGSDQSHCFLISDAQSSVSRQRIKAMQSSTNGFDLARWDLAIRGPGNLLGAKQSGELMFSFADASDDALIQRITALCNQMISNRETYSPIFSFYDRQATVSSALLN